MNFQASLHRGRAVGIAIAVLGLGAWGFAMVSSRQVAMQSYLYGYVTWMSLTLGCYGLSLLHNATRGTWSLPVIRLAEAGGGAVALSTMAVLFVPIALSLPLLYPWADPVKVQADHILQMKAPYLNVPFFLGRTVGYFVVWMLFASAMRRSSVREDSSRDYSETDRRSSIGAPGLVAFALTVSFAATDWVMSLEPRWYSSIYGIIFMSQAVLSAMALTIGLVVLNLKKEPYRDISAPAFKKDSGTMLFAAVMFWAYVILSQYLIIYAADLPEFTSYYLARTTGGWNVLANAVVIGGFFVPFTALLAPRTRQTVTIFLIVIAMVLAVRITDLYLLVMPALRKNGLEVHWTDFAAFAGIGGAWLTVFAHQALKAPLLPIRQPRIEGEQEAAHA